MIMLTIDTNVLVRLLVAFDTDQRVVVERLAVENRLFIPMSVVLEAEWVLRSAVKIDAQSINTIFRGMLATDGLVIEQPTMLGYVLDLHAGGMDFADAMHLSCAADDSTFVTFDRDLVRRARKIIPDVSVALANEL